MIRVLCAVALLVGLTGCPAAIVGLGVTASALTVGKDLYEWRDDYLVQHETAVIKVDHACPTPKPC